MANSKQRVLPIIIYHIKPSNRVLLDKYKDVSVIIGVEHPILRRLLHFVHDSLVNTQYQVNLRHPRRWRSIDGKEAWNKAPPIIRLSQSDHTQGSARLSKLGINKDDSFVCIAVPQIRYFEAREGRISGSIDYLGGGAIELSTYYRAAEYLNEMGIFVLNMGLHQDYKLDPDGPIIDYASICRSELGDIYVMARSKFFISSGTGLFKLAAALNTPCIDTNRIVPLYNPPPYKFDITIPRKLYDSSKQRYLTFREILTDKSYKTFKQQSVREKKGIKSHNNTSDEIYEAVKEMNERLDGTYQCQKDDETLQKQYCDLIQEYLPEYRSRIGSRFIQDNQFLIG